MGIKRVKWWLSGVIALAVFFNLLYVTPVGAASSYQIEISKSKNVLTLYKDGIPYKNYRVATGRTEDLTPEGTFTLVNKITGPGWHNSNTGEDIPGGDPRNPLGEKWMGISVNGDKGRKYGIHGTNKPESIGTNASSGCVRVGKEELRELYSIVPTGTPVWIHKEASKGKWEGDPSYAVQPTTGKVKVSVDKTTIYDGPSEGAFVIKGYENVKKGTELNVIGFVQQWYQIKLNNDKIGFVKKAHVTKVQTVPAPGNNQEQIKDTSGMVQTTVDQANLRSTPSLNGSVVQRLKKNTKLELTGEGKDWFRVRLSSGYTGYLHKSVAKKINQPAPTVQKIKVVVALANIRKAPATKAPVLQRVKKGQILNKIGSSGNWHIIKLSNSQTGFIQKDLAK
ncbi:SH3 domain-containing protein [Seinonella peptonophila]|uniref:SH3 domain-containing protein n=1 Tax=Seinonella peptonophila TaxID=112248 RepID=A0A1M4VRB9_9BACL|nr:SH3 domain-containing protein [Seinonella peptonophila]SHE71342.1 SH3 domain-containing protein [Seinonella peptonophila]